MLKITIPSAEFYDERRREFVYTEAKTIQLEHSLLSLSKWESKWKKPLLDKFSKLTTEETLDYIRCMTITPNVDPLIYAALTQDLINQITEYIGDPMTATTVPKQSHVAGTPRERITSELIYYWMVALNIPFECQKWHLNRLLTLIDVCDFKSRKPKKRSAREIMQERNRLNAERRAQYNSKG